MIKYSLDKLSRKALKILPEILDAAGYAGKYEIHPELNTIVIATTTGKITKFLLEAESKAQGEPGRMITIRKTSYSQIWIPETEIVAETETDALMQAYKKAFSYVENGWPVENDQVIEVTGVETIPYYWDENDVDAYFERRRS